MSSTASDYSIPKLVIGQIFAAMAVLLALLVAGPTLTTSISGAAPFLATTIAYGVMMFASSYVEEEQHFWYWTNTAWIMALFFKKSAPLT